MRGERPVSPVLEWDEASALRSTTEYSGSRFEVLLARVAAESMSFLVGSEGRVCLCAHPDCAIVFGQRHRTRRFGHESCSQRSRRTRYYVVGRHAKPSAPARAGDDDIYSDAERYASSIATLLACWEQLARVFELLRSSGRQEIWGGHLCCHYAIRTLIFEGAQRATVDPDRVSFVAALRIARRSLSQARDSSPLGAVTGPGPVLSPCSPATSTLSGVTAATPASAHARYPNGTSNGRNHADWRQPTGPPTPTIH